MTYPEFSYAACFIFGNYRQYLTISQVGSRWFADKRNDNGFSSLLTITICDADSHDELISKITGKVA
jgi:hypothetical protein